MIWMVYEGRGENLGVQKKNASVCTVRKVQDILVPLNAAVLITS
jgi:hypothetical protein